MLVSIITATFNSSHLIKETYECLNKQSYSNWEWLVTDDCSSDNTLELIKNISKVDHRVKVFSNLVNSGAAVSRNKSLANASGDFIAFIDSDDIWAPTKLEQQIGFMESNHLDFTFTAYELIDSQGYKLGVSVDANQKGSFTYEDMLKKKATLGCSTVMLRASRFSDISMPLLRTGQDYATWLKLLKTGTNAYIFDKVLTQYRILPNSISRNKIRKSMRQWQIYRNIEKLSLIKSAYCFYFYAYRAVFRK
ncbi:glycosyltransferase family 2 protein [Vibrio sp. 1CM23M]|uniref:glycosyltransferase family 2 protein n=1 Tax=Vibrio sp. 1CM23M TaxID=2929164 RepID=UPI0020BF0307|nr:glycosyltransferase family 2 protein [Vibrio sp. 1CM23M]MCK8073711.1 glycosyltransferase [Vibrio sp. 1CM23M]